MSLSAAAVKYRPIVLTCVTLLTLWGIYSVQTMPRREDPAYTVRTCAVTTAWPGAPTEKVEELITKPPEEAFDTIDEIDVVRSTTTVGLSTIYVDAEDLVTPEQIDNVWDKVRARVAAGRVMKRRLVGGRLQHRRHLVGIGDDRPGGEFNEHHKEPP